MIKDQDFIDYYEVLQVHPSASVSIIKKAYRTLIMEIHPDLGGSEEKSKQLNEAYTTLSDPEKRHEYDRLRALRLGEFLRTRGTSPLDQIIIICPACETKNRVKSEESIKFAKCRNCGYKFAGSSKTARSMSESTGKTTNRLAYSEWVLNQNQKPPLKVCLQCGKHTRLFSSHCPGCGAAYPDKKKFRKREKIFTKELLSGILGIVGFTGLVSLFIISYPYFQPMFVKEKVKPKVETTLAPDVYNFNYKGIQEAEKKALMYTDKKQYDVAINEWKEIIKDAPTNEKAHFNLGQLYLHMNRPKEAIAELETSLALMPDDSGTHFALGNAYVTMNNPEKGIEHFKRSIELNPYNGMAYYNLGVVYTNKGQNNLAINQYKEALKIKPDNTDVMVNLSIVYAKKGDYDSSFLYLKRVTELKPGDPDAHFNMGIVYQQQGNTQAAIKEYNLSLDLFKNMSPTPEIIQKIKVVESILKKL